MTIYKKEQKFKGFKLSIEKNRWIGGGFVLLAAIAYACMGALVKGGGKTPDEILVFMRNIICLITLLPFILLPRPKPLNTSFLGTHLVRSLAGLLNMYCFFYSLRSIPLTDAMLLNNTMPLFVPLVMWIWKGQKIPYSLIPALIIGFLGILLILHPGSGILQPGALLALASGIFMSISMAGIRELGKIEPIYRILFYYFLIGTCISALPLIWVWKTPSLFLWSLFVGIGLFAALYQYLLTKGYQYASASKISPLIYFAVILSALFDWIFWHVAPSWLSYVGVTLVIVGAILSLRTKKS